MSNIRICIESSSGNEHELEIEFDYSVGNDGIGPYEYWGCKGYDKGTDYIEDITITGIEIVCNFPRKDKSGNPILSKDGYQQYKEVYRRINPEKLFCVDLEEIEKKIMEEFNLEDEEIDYCEYDY